MRRVEPLLAVAALAVATTLSACGGGGAKGVADEATLEGIKSAHFDFSLRIEPIAKGGQAKETTLSGAFQAGSAGGPPQVQIAESRRSGSESFKGGATLLSDGSAYVSYQGAHYKLEAETLAGIAQWMGRGAYGSTSS